MFPALSSTRLQGEAPPTWSASPTSTPSTPSWTTWSWFARSTAHWRARGRTRCWPKVHTSLCGRVVRRGRFLQCPHTLKGDPDRKCFGATAIVGQRCVYIPVSLHLPCRGVCSCCQQVRPDHSHGNRHPVPVGRPALPLRVTLTLMLYEITHWRLLEKYCVSVMTMILTCVSGAWIFLTLRGLRRSRKDVCLTTLLKPKNR